MPPKDSNEQLGSPEETIEEQVRNQTGQKKIRVRIDEGDVVTTYASGFRPVVTPEEVILDFGLNIPRLTGSKDVPHEVVFKVNNRIAMNYYSAKRVALTLVQIVRRYEDRFGEIELNAVKRQTSKKS